MPESSPYQEERQIEESIEDELLTLLLLAYIRAGNVFTGSSFDFNLVNDSQSQFRKELSKIIPTLNQKGTEAIDVGLERAMRQTDLSNLSYNFGSQRFQDSIREIFDKHIGFLTETNERSVQRLLEIAADRGWSDQEILRRLRLYFGLVPDHINTVVKLEDALIREGASRSVIRDTVQKKIDQLREWRSSLIAAQVATEITENSKAVAFAEMLEEGEIAGDYVKQWVSVVDENTTQICTSSHLTIAELNANFSNGMFSPPAFPPPHACRSSIRIIKRPQE